MTPPEPRFVSRHALFLGASAVVALVVLVAARAVLLPFVLAFVLAYVLIPAVAWVERRRVPRALAIVLVYAAVLGSFAGFVRLSTPRVALEVATFRRELPTIARKVRVEWVPAIEGRLKALGLAEMAAPLPPSTEREGPPEASREAKGLDGGAWAQDLGGKSLGYAQEHALELVKLGRDVIASISRFFFLLGITLMLGAYTILTRDRILGFFESLVSPSRRASWRSLLARIDRGLAGVVRGQLVICLVNGVLSAVGFALCGLKYWPVLALIATVFSLIPIFGAILSSIPAVFLGLTQSFGTGVFVLAWILGIHQLEANVLNPKIMGDAAKIHPLLVVFSLLVGEHFFGGVGALLAVPVMSIAQSVFLHVREDVEAREPRSEGEPGPQAPSGP